MVRPYAVASLALAALLGCGREGSGVIAPRITVDPSDLVVSECGNAEFSVQVSGDHPLTYRWFIDGVLALEAPGHPGEEPRSTFALGRVGLASDGRRVRVEVSNAGGSTTSREASLSVTAAPSPALILPEVSAMGLAASGLDVYWTDGVRVVGASLDCEGPVRTLFERLDFWTTTVAWMTLAGDQVVWANYLGGDIRATAIDGSATTTLVSNLGVILGVLEDRGSIYWIGSQGIGSTSISGGPVAHLHPSWLNSDGLAADDAFVYWYDLDAREIGRHAIDGAGSSETLASGLVHPSSIAADGQYVYWGDTDASQPLRGSISRIARNGGPVKLVAQVEGGVGRLLLEDGHVYWTAGAFDGAGAGKLYRALSDGSGTPELLASGLSGPFYLATGSDSLLVSDHDGIKRIPKPIVP